MKSENYFISVLNKLGIPHVYEDDWYDFEVLGQKIEVKSCRVGVKCVSHGKQSIRMGRFDFTKEFNRDLQYQENIWVLFMVRHKEQFIILGLCHAKKLEKKRYIPLHHTRKLDLIDLEEWIEIYNK